MIRLFNSTATDFSTLGLGNLTDATMAIVTEERNGTYELELDYPIDGIHYSEIELRSIIVCKPNPFTDEQAFRVYGISRPINGLVTINAAHISYDLSGIVVNPYSANSVAGAISGIKTNASTTCPFNFSATKSGDGGFSVDVPTSARAILGGTEGSILDVYGKGEYEFDNYNVKLYTNRGANNGVTLRYGKNITDLKQDENCDNIYTGVYPYWKGSETTYDESGGSSTSDVLVTLPEKIVSVSGTFNFQRILALDMGTYFQEKPTVEQVRNKTNDYITNNNVGKPSISLTVSFIQLEQTEEYETLRLLETVRLCDTVNIKFPKLGVDAEAKCIKTDYNAITGKYESLEFGDSRTNLSSTISNQNETLSQAPTLGFMDAAIQRATSLITGGLGGYVILHSSTGSDTPDELLILEPSSKGDYLKANKIWRWNYKGLGYSNKGYNGPYELAMTIDGQINAAFINTGQLNVGGSGQATSINVYNSSGTKKLVWFDNSGIHLDSSQSISWGNVDHPTDLVNTKTLTDTVSSSYVGVETLYYATYVNYNTTKPSAPSKPTSQVTATDKSFDKWTKNAPDVKTDKRSGSTELFQYNCYYWMVPQYQTKGGSYSWGDVVEIDNATATTVITKNAITTSYINALSVTAKSVSANDISAGTIYACQFGSGQTGDTSTINMKNGAGVGLAFGADIGYQSALTVLATNENRNASNYAGKIIVKAPTQHSGNNYNGMYIDVQEINYYDWNQMSVGAYSGIEFQNTSIFAKNDDWSVNGHTITSSDIRLKENIKDISINLIRKLFSKLDFKSFVYKRDKTKEAYGLIAQEVEVVLDDIGIEKSNILYEEQGYYKLSYENIDRFCIPAVKDLYEICEKQQEEIDILKQQIKELKEGK